MVPFNRPHIVGKELEYIARAHDNGQLAGDGPFTRQCQTWLERRTGARKALLTHSCTAALEMAAILADISPGDEVIMPSFTFVSTANAFVLRGAGPVFVDIRSDTLNLDESQIEAAITPQDPCDRPGALRRRRLRDGRDPRDRCNDMTCWSSRMRRRPLRRRYRGQSLGAIGHWRRSASTRPRTSSAGEGGALLINDPMLIGTCRDHPREGHQPQPVLPRPGGQVHLGRHWIVVPAGRDRRGVPLGTAGAG